MSADCQFITEYQLLEIYHEKRKSKSSTKSMLTVDHQIWQRKIHQESFKFSGPNIRVPASAKTDEFSQVADKLTHIVDSVPPAQDQVVTDSDIIQRLVELIKEYGDQVNEKIKMDVELSSYLQGLLSYNMFEQLASAFISSVVPLGKQKKEEDDQKLKIAWTFEMTSRLSALDLQPMNRIMGFGAQYVHQQFALWIQQHGGWNNAFETDESDEVQ